MWPLLAAALSGLTAASDPLAADDECGASCALSALQRRAAVVQGGWGSCVLFGCGGFRPQLGCQCNSKCSRYGNCCYDYSWICASRPPQTTRPQPPTVPPGSACTNSWSHNCLRVPRCCDPSKTCYVKNRNWGACLASCAPGIHWSEPPQHRSPWSCQVVGTPTLLPPTPPPTPPTTPPPTTRPTTVLTTTTVRSTVTLTGSAESTTPTSTEVDGTDPDAYYKLHNPQHAQPSSAPLHTFYAYRVQNDQDYPPENQNLANAAGTLWYLHNELVWPVPRRFGKTRVQRYRVQVKATQALYNKGMNFGVRMAFDAGRCTGPYWMHSDVQNCNKDWDTYGFVVGCNHVGSFPTQQWSSQVHYPNAIWYSFPGECPNQKWYSHNDDCRLAQPGGACADPTGAGDCTYNYKLVGEISIDDLDGVGDYWSFVEAGGKEYDKKLDRGIHNSFWNYKSNDTACALRVKAMQRLFKALYPEEPEDSEFPEPPCDFSESVYYSQAKPGGE